MTTQINEPNEGSAANLPAPQAERALAAPGSAAVYKAHEDEARNLKAGRIFLKFSKGDWLIGKDAESFADNTFVFVPAMDMFEKGWQCWKGGRPIDERFVAYGSPGIPQSQLADHSPYPGKNDGWVEAIKFPLMIVPDGANTAAWMNVEFAASSTGGKNACYSLSKQFYEKHKLGEITKDKPYILCRATADSYDHKEWGKVHFPAFEVLSALSDAEIRKLLGTAKTTNGHAPDSPGKPEATPEAKAVKTALDKPAKGAQVAHAQVAHAQVAHPDDGSPPWDDEADTATEAKAAIEQEIAEAEAEPEVSEEEAEAELALAEAKAKLAKAKAAKAKALAAKPVEPAPASAGKGKAARKKMSI